MAEKWPFFSLPSASSQRGRQRWNPFQQQRRQEGVSELPGRGITCTPGHSRRLGFIVLPPLSYPAASDVSLLKGWWQGAERHALTSLFKPQPTRALRR